MLDPKFLACLACPVCEDRPPLKLDGDTLVCSQCGGIYPITNGIPQLLPENRQTPESRRESEVG